MLMRKCLLATLILMLVILMLLNLNTGYADTDAELCIRIMSLCCIYNLSIIKVNVLITSSFKASYTEDIAIASVANPFSSCMLLKRRLLTGGILSSAIMQLNWVNPTSVPNSCFFLIKKQWWLKQLFLIIEVFIFKNKNTTCII